MKKMIMIVTISILLVGANLYAAGDLVVNGKIGAGTATPNYKIHVESDNEQSGLRVYASYSNTSFTTNSGAFYSIKATQEGIDNKRYLGFQGEVNLIGSGNVWDMIGTENVIAFNAATAGSTIGTVKGNTVILRRGSLNTKNHTITNYYGFHSLGQASTGTGAFNGTTWRHAYFEDFPNYGGTRAEVTGLWIDRQTRGTTNYGIVLNGDGAGADIVFGSSQQASIYSSAGLLYAKDMNGNITQFSPHDPETGEWIYYSKNTKTGVVKRVNMEKLVKAVEKLTGEQFLFESLAEDK